MNLCISGGAGFIGCNLIRQIIDEPEIETLVNLDCLTYAGSVQNTEGFRFNPKYIFSKTDLRDKELVASVIARHEITHVIHLAAESHVDRSISGPDDFISTNIVGTFNLLEACRGRNIRLLHVSTDEVYGSLGPEGLFTEASPYDPSSPYSASKASSDMLVRAYHRTYGMDAIITNCSNNYGPYQFPEKLIPLVIKNALEGKPIPVYGDGKNVRDWLYVRDHATALWRVLKGGVTGESYNIGGHNEWTNIRIVELICDLIGGDSRKLITFVKDRPGHDRRYAIDASKIQRVLSWSPSYTFEQGIKETVEWYTRQFSLTSIG